MADLPAGMIKAFKAVCDTLGHYSRPDAVRVMIKTDTGWAPDTPDYRSGPERAPPRDLREAADRWEADEDVVRELAGK